MSPGHGADTGMHDEPTGACSAMRQVLDRVGDRWSLLTVLALRDGPLRFNRLRRELDGVSQRMLTLTLRRLERDGLVSRVVHPSVPPQVEYALTALGQSLRVQVQSLLDWAIAHQSQMDAARQRFDLAAADAPANPRVAGD